MTREQLMTLSGSEIDRLPADELAVLERHFGTTNKSTLVQLFAQEAEETWSGPSEAPVPANEWVDAHLQLLLQVHRQEKREHLTDTRMQLALDRVDALDPARRALLCWRFHATAPRWVAARTVAVTLKMMEDNAPRTISFEQALPWAIQREIDLQIAETDSVYRYRHEDIRLPVQSAKKIDPTRVRDHLMEAARELEAGRTPGRDFAQLLEQAHGETTNAASRRLLHAGLDVYSTLSDARGFTEELVAGVAQALRGIAAAWSNIQEISPPLEEPEGDTEEK